MTPANSTLASHALRWDARPRIARADGPQWFPPPSTGLEPPAPTPVHLALVPETRVARLPGDRPAPRHHEVPRRNPTHLRRHREMVP